MVENGHLWGQAEEKEWRCEYNSSNKKESEVRNTKNLKGKKLEKFWIADDAWSLNLWYGGKAPKVISTILGEAPRVFFLSQNEAVITWFFTGKGWWEIFWQF